MDNPIDSQQRETGQMSNPMNTATTFKRIGVIGAGVMGIGLAQNLAQTNHQVVLVDVTTSALEQAKTKIQQNVRFAKLLNAKAGKDAPVLPASAITDPAAPHPATPRWREGRHVRRS